MPAQAGLHGVQLAAAQSLPPCQLLRKQPQRRRQGRRPSHTGRRRAARRRDVERPGRLDLLGQVLRDSRAAVDYAPVAREAQAQELVILPDDVLVPRGRGRVSPGKAAVRCSGCMHCTSTMCSLLS